MADDAGIGARSRQLAADAEKIRSRAEDLRQQAVEAAEGVALTEEAVAKTLNRLAEHFPHRANHLQAMSETAGKLAANARQWAKDHSSGMVGLAGLRSMSPFTPAAAHHRLAAEAESAGC